MRSEKIRCSVNLSGAKLVSRLILIVSRTFHQRCGVGRGWKGREGREEKRGEGREEKGGEGREENGGEGREGGVFIMVTSVMPVGFWCNMFGVGVISQIFLTKT